MFFVMNLTNGEQIETAFFTSDDAIDAINHMDEQDTPYGVYTERGYVCIVFMKKVWR